MPPVLDVAGMGSATAIDPSASALGLAVSQLAPGLQIHGRGPFQLTTGTLGPAVLFHAVTSQHTAERPRRRSRDPEAATLCICLGVAAAAEVRHAGQVAQLAQGDIVLVDSDLGFTLEAQSGHQQTVLQIPKQLLAERSRRLALLSGQRLSADDPKTLAVFEALRALHAAAESFSVEDHVAGFRAALHLLDLLGPAPLDAVADEARFARTRAIVVEHLADPRLSPDALASLQHVSRRTLEQCFARKGLTLSRFIWDCRLERAADEIASDFAAQRKLLAIASDCGFTSAAHFARAFRLKFGLSPSAFRRDTLLKSAVRSPAALEPSR